MTDDLVEPAQHVLDQLDGVDRELVLRRFATERELAEAMAARAARMLDALDGPVPAEQRPLLLAATLTRGPQSLGVHANNGNALKRFRVLRELGAPPVRIALQCDAQDDRQDVLDAVRTDRVDTALARSREEAPVLRTMVAAAVAVTCPDDDPVPVAEAVLDRGADLAARYRAARPLPDLGSAGNADLLVTVAAYAVAGSAVRPDAEPGTGLDAMQALLPGLAGALRSALHHPVSRTELHGVDEPDSLRFLRVAATTIGGTEGRRAEAAYRKVRPEVRTMRLRRDRRLVPAPVEESPELFAVPPETDDLDLDGVAGRIVDGLLCAPDADREVLARWLSGDRPPDRTDDLPGLLTAMRGLLLALLGSGGSADPEPTGAPAVRAALVGILKGRIAAATAVDGESWTEARHIAAALPPLWTRRAAAERALAAAARVAHGYRSVNEQAMAAVLGMLAARGPVQVMTAASLAQHRGRGDDPPRCRTGHDPAPTVDEVCPARPWGDIGLVDSYRTLATGSGIGTSEAVRRRLERYLRDGDSPWLPLVRPRSP